MSGVLDLIRAAKRPERSVDLCLRGDLYAEHEELNRELAAALKGRSVDGVDGQAGEVADRIKALEVEMSAATVTMHLRAIGSKRTMDLIVDHPPRAKDDDDKRMGYNRETYYPALVSESCYAITSPDGDRLDVRDADGKPTDAAMNDADWSALIDALSNHQWDRLVAAAINLDHSNIEVPTSPLASRISQLRGESSKQPGVGDSRQASSPGGSAGRSRRTSTTKRADSSAL